MPQSIPGLVEDPGGTKVVGFAVLQVVEEARPLTILNVAAVAAADVCVHRSRIMATQPETVLKRTACVAKGSSFVASLLVKCNFPFDKKLKWPQPQKYFNYSFNSGANPSSSLSPDQFLTPTITVAAVIPDLPFSPLISAAIGVSRVQGR
uniref:Uncharacterized protein n=1 Tax=Nelumbo nucifera TaxID=4432 RepID=A0A822XX90_NELNU|nr:TPA_asm: hypothetical protein HUJ06_026096 [Nelumbo nucifera]